nr:oligosaccharide flippase family protein [Clostridium sp. D33t1_170424_F3]
MVCTGKGGDAVKKRGEFLANTAILTGGTLLLRFCNIWFRVYIIGKIGTEGMGLYQLIFSIFSLAIATCTSGAGLTVTRMVAEGRGTRPCIRKCLIFSLSVSFLAAAVLWIGSDFFAQQFLNIESGLPLRLLAPGLPFMAICACLKGYFLAVRNSVVPALAELLEQFTTIGATVAFFFVFTPFSALMLASTVGEVASCAVVFFVYRLMTRKRPTADCSRSAGYRQIAHIAMPVLSGSFIRSFLSSTENLLVPRGLKRFGADSSSALSQYGIIQGMVMPILFFPSSFLSSMSSMLIPELAEANAQGKHKSIEESASRTFRFTLLFSFLVTTLLIVYAEDLGTAFYNSREAGMFLRIMAPIIPLMYLDSVVDGMLKGLDQQMYSFKYNFMDSIMRVILIATALPLFGVKAYIFILFLSEIFNASLSISRLLKVARVEVDIVGWILTPAVSAALLYYVLTLLRQLC